MAKRAGKKVPFLGHKDTCKCTKCRVANLEIVVANLMTTVEDVLIPHAAQNLKKEGKGLFLRSDGRYVVGKLPESPKLKPHPPGCTCKLCKSIKK
ncbi:hypothetical protein [Sulfuricurvum sp.]|uniref:hypothetical protein n=1 Tax=Sulfuricurvum sp. TaxID=2025608 RepID=UPI00356A8ED3